MTTIDHDLPPAPPLPAQAPLAESFDSNSDAVTVALAHLIASAEPAVVFSSLAELSVGAFSDACTVDIVEEDQAAYRISYPHTDASPLVALAAPRAPGAATGLASARTVRTRIQVTPVPGHPHYAGVVVHTWNEHHPNHADTTIAQLLVDRAIAVITQERLTDSVQHANEESATLEAGLESSRQIGMAMGMLMTLNKVDAEAAFATLREESSHTNTKLRDVAARFVTTHTPTDPVGGSMLGPPAKPGQHRFRTGSGSAAVIPGTNGESDGPRPALVLQPRSS